MQIKTNVRAGSQNQKRSSTTDSTSTDASGSSQAAGTTGFYVPPTSRCVGI